MKKLMCIVVSVLVAGVLYSGCIEEAAAQCNGVFAANQVCGSVAGGVPGPVNSTALPAGTITSGVTPFAGGSSTGVLYANGGFVKTDAGLTWAPGGPLTITPTAGTRNQAIVQNIVGPAGGSFPSGNYFFNQITATSSAANTGAGAMTSAFFTSLIIDGTGAKGAVWGHRIDVGLTASVAMGDLIAIVPRCVLSAPNSTGGCYGANAQAILQSGAILNSTNGEVAGLEADVSISTGASAAWRFGLAAFGGGQVRGTLLDAAIEISAGSTTGSFNNGIMLNSGHGAVPLSTTACLICTDGVAATIATGIDLSAYTISGNFLKSATLTITGTGAVTDTNYGLGVIHSSAGGAFTSSLIVTADITAANITYALIQNVAASRLLGNPTGAPAAPSEISLSSPLAFSGTSLACATCVTSAASLTANQIVIGSGSQGEQSLGTLGTTTTVLHGNAAGAPTFAAVVSTDLNITTTTCTNQFITAISATAVGTCTTATLASAQFANQGTVGTVLHGNAAGNPAFSAVNVASEVTGILAVANGGTNCSAASITCFNNITGFTASGTTGTTSTNLVFSGAPTFTTSITVPLIIGGSGTTGTQLTLQTTTGNGTTDAFAFKGGNNGATTFGAWSTSGLGVGGSTINQLGIGSTHAVTIQSTSARSVLELINSSTGTNGVAGSFAYYNGSERLISMDTTADGATNSARWDVYVDNAGSLVSQLALLHTGQLIVGLNGTGGLSVGAATDPGVTNLLVQGQMFMPSITQTSAAQTGTVCWTSGGSPAGKFTVDTTVGCLTSIGPAKDILSDLASSNALRMVVASRPVSFRYKSGYGDEGRYEQFGFVAEEMAQIDERTVGRDYEGNLHGVRYMEFTAVLSGAIKEIVSACDAVANDNFCAELKRRIVR